MDILANTYVLKDDKTIRPTQTSPHRKNDHNVETISILVPQFCNNHDLKKCSVIIEFRRENENKKIPSKMIRPQSELYKGHLVYRVPVTRELTSEIGKVYFSLTFSAVNFNLNTGFESYFQVIG